MQLARVRIAPDTPAQALVPPMTTSAGLAVTSGIRWDWLPHVPGEDLASLPEGVLVMDADQEQEGLQWQVGAPSRSACPG